MIANDLKSKQLRFSALAHIFSNVCILRIFGHFKHLHFCCMQMCFNHPVFCSILIQKFLSFNFACLKLCELTANLANLRKFPKLHASENLMIGSSFSFMLCQMEWHKCFPWHKCFHTKLFSSSTLIHYYFFHRSNFSTSFVCFFGSKI